LKTISFVTKRIPLAKRALDIIQILRGSEELVKWSLSQSEIVLEQSSSI